MKEKSNPKICIVCHSPCDTKAKFCTHCGAILLKDTTKQSYAGFWIRLAAYYTDSTILGLLILGVLFLIKTFWTSTLPIWLFSTSLLGLHFIYNIVSITLFSTTIGKWLFGLKVLNLQQKKPKFKYALIRAIGYYISLFFLLGFWMLIFSKRKRSLHDHMAKTFVLRQKKSLFLPIILMMIGLISYTYVNYKTNGELYNFNLPSNLDQKYISTELQEADMDFQQMLEDIKSQNNQFSVPLQSSNQIQSSQEIYSKYIRSVALIITDKGLGTGFVISPHGLVATNYHVVDGAKKVAVAFQDGEYHFVEYVVDYEEDIDVAILKISKEDLTPLPLGKSYNSSIGEDVTVIGNPEGFSFSVSKGIVSAGNRMIGGIRLIQIDAAISSGSSGGPVFNKHGQVIGITTMTWTRGQNINFAVPIENIYNLSYKRLDQDDYSSNIAEAYITEPVEDFNWKENIVKILSLLLI